MDTETVARVARLARLAVSPDQQKAVAGELGQILAFVEQLNSVDVTGIKPVAGVHDDALRQRDDVVNDGNCAADILQNAPQTMADFFVVPKVVE